MSAPRPGQSYLSSSRSIALHETFVANVQRIMTERNLGATRDANAVHRTSRQINWLAEHSGIPVRTVENLMRLNNQPTMVGAAAIARALNVPLDTLLGQDPAMFTAPNLSRSSTIACIHSSSHLPDMQVCQSCLSKWQSYQRRLSDLYETARAEHREANPIITANEIAQRERESAARIAIGGCGMIDCVNQCGGDDTWETCPAAKRARIRANLPPGTDER